MSDETERKTYEMKPRNEFMVVVKINVDLGASVLDSDLVAVVGRMVTGTKLKHELQAHVDQHGVVISELECWVRPHNPDYLPNKYKARAREKVNDEWALNNVPASDKHREAEVQNLNNEIALLRKEVEKLNGRLAEQLKEVTHREHVKFSLHNQIRELTERLNKMRRR